MPATNHAVTARMPAMANMAVSLFDAIGVMRVFDVRRVFTSEA
jgi:hypothetical protein